MGKIIVKVNEEYQVRALIEPNSEESIFSSFVQAKMEIEDIISDTEKYYRAQNKSYCSNLCKQQCLSNKSFDFSNNIIAFSGDRGQGKSSAMISFSNFLLYKHTDKNKKFLGEKICKADYIVLDRIDPTKFEIGDNILTVILAKIFNEFCKEWDVSEKNDIALRSELLELFQSCYKEIDTIKHHSSNSKSFIGNDLDRLGRIGDSANLKEHLLTLIEKYFDFHYRVQNKCASKENSFLVIQLDDTDLNTKNAYSIVEDVRKYFMIPNVIVLMAVDLSLLTSSIEQNYIMQFKDYTDYHSDEKSNEYHKMAVKYIDKLIPGGRKIFMPDIKPSTDEYGEQTTIEYIDGDSESTNLLKFANNYGNDIKDVQELLLRFIYEKTGLVFIKPNNYRHNIVPGTMRELVNFLSVLNNMESIENDYSSVDDLNKRINNLFLFESYFTKTWIPNYVESAYSRIIENLLNSPWTIKNKQVLIDISNLYKTTFNKEGEELFEDVFDRIETEASENNDIYTLANVRESLYELESRIPEQKIYKLTFAIRTIYSIYTSRLICNGLLHEIKGENYDYGIICSFLGGDVFGKNANQFIRKEYNRYDRAVFKADVSDDDETFNDLNEFMKNEDNAYIAALFCNFEFPYEQEFTPPYDVSYKRLGNNAKSSVWNFNVSYPFIYLLQPRKIYERISGIEVDFDMKIKFPMEILSVRYACVQIISSMDLINFLDKNLRKRFVTRSNRWDFYEYIIDFFERVQDCINKIEYLPIKNDWKEFIKYVENSSNILIALHSIYTDNYDYIPEFELLRYEVSKLSTYKNTKDYDTLNKKINDLYYRLDKLSEYYDNVVIDDFRDIVGDLAENVRANEEKITLNEIKLYQRELNRIVRDIKDYFSE